MQIKNETQVFFLTKVNQMSILTLSGPQQDFSDDAERHYKTNTGILQLGCGRQSPPFKDGG